MKVTILSMQRIRNWGSFLQAFALKSTIESLGHECSFIDVMPAVGLSENERSELNKNKGGMSKKINLFFIALKYFLKGQIFKRVKSLKYQKSFVYKYDNEFIPLLGIDPEKYIYKKECDVAIIGSDEVFNCAQENIYNRTMHLFGQGIKANKLISYAASFGYTTISKLEELGLSDRVSSALSKFSEISVRDENSLEVVTRLAKAKAIINVDPVIIYNFDPHLPGSVPDRNYIVVYSYQGRINDKLTIKAILEFARKNNKKIISLYSYYPWCDKCITPKDPFELLAYFRDASYAITDTFHGSIFSLKFNKQFCTIVRSSNANKLKFLLNQFGLSERIVNNPSEINDLLLKEIDYSFTNEVISKETNKSLLYLEKSIS